MIVFIAPHRHEGQKRGIAGWTVRRPVFPG
jgi:hypothetical protein